MPFLYQMNVEIGNIVKGLLEPFVVGGSGTNQFIDSLAGVVKVLSKQERHENEGVIIKTFPVACDMSFADCSKPGKLKELMLESKLCCIFY